MGDLVRSDFSRVFLIEDSAGPSHPYAYQGLMSVGAASFEQGDTTLIYVPDPTSYGKFRVADKIPGEPGAPELVVRARYSKDLSTLLRLAKAGCDHDVQLHMGECQNPQDFNKGWDKVLILERARIGPWGTDDLGALGPDERAQPNEEVTFTGEDMYEIKRLTFATKAGTSITQEIVDVVICDTASCGSCGVSSNGCDKIFAITMSNGASPGASAAVIYSDDGGLTWGVESVDSLSPVEDPDAAACVGVNLVVVSNESGSLHWAALADILLGTADFAEVLTGFVGGGEPNAIKSVGPTFTWIVGNGGYIYFTDDPTSGVTVQDAGVATTENLNDIDAIDEETAVAVGANNAVVFTANGGLTWASVVGPSVGVVLNCVHMVDENVWWVGTAGGKLYYTINAGVTWVEKTFPGSGAGAVKDIEFSTPSVGYMVHNTAAPLGRILRTINGGFSWYVAPEGSGTIPTNQGLNAVAACVDPNKVFAGGVTVVAGDGILISGA